MKKLKKALGVKVKKKNKKSKVKLKKLAAKKSLLKAHNKMAVKKKK